MKGTFPYGSLAALSIRDDQLHIEGGHMTREEATIP